MDTQFSCGEGSRVEHVLWERAYARVAFLLSVRPRTPTAYAYAIIRNPVDRVVSHWLHCATEHLKLGNVSRGTGVCSHGAGVPHRGVPYVSDESFSHFLRMHAHGPSSKQFLSGELVNFEGVKAEVAWNLDINGIQWFRTANLQVGMTASVPAGISELLLRASPAWRAASGRQDQP